MGQKRVINIGKLNKRITFLRLGDAKDSMGQTVQALEKIKTVWGTLYPVRGAEFYEIQKTQSRVTHKCYIRYVEGIDSNCYLQYKEKVYSIESALDVDLEHKLLEIMCCEFTNKEVMRFGRTDAGAEF